MAKTYNFLGKTFTDEDVYNAGDTGSQYRRIVEESKRKLATNPEDTAAQKNLQYYSPGGAGFEDTLRDYQLKIAGEIGKGLGLTASQLYTNPQLATDPQALAKYTGKSYGGVSYAPGTEEWAKNQAPQAPIPGIANQPPPLPQQGQTYAVQQGDTLSAIAQRYGVPVSAITGYRSGNPNLIYPGEVLQIGQNFNQAGQTPAPPQITPSGAVNAPQSDITGGQGADTDSILQQYGLDGQGTGALTINQIVQQISDAFGLKDTKDKITKLDTEMGNEIQEAEDNPWLSAQAQQEQINSITKKYSGRKDALYERLKTEQPMIAAALDLYQQQQTNQQQILLQAMKDKSEQLNKTTTDLINYNAVKNQGYQGDFNTFLKEQANLKASGGGDYKPPVSYQEWELAGGVQGTGKTYSEWVAQQNVKPATVSQQTVATYAARIEQANPILNKLENAITKMNPLAFEAQIRMPSYLQGSEMQQYMQAARNFVNAVLRRESGAVISPSEFDNAYNQYLPRPGDSTETLKQKKQNRDVVYQSFKKASGSAYQSVDELLGTGGGDNDPLGIR